LESYAVCGGCGIACGNNTPLLEQGKTALKCKKNARNDCKLAKSLANERKTSLKQIIFAKNQNTSCFFDKVVIQ
jgi:RNase H-fold protein (predicted Holliday junction resolvase)